MDQRIILCLIDSAAPYIDISKDKLEQFFINELNSAQQKQAAHKVSLPFKQQLDISCKTTPLFLEKLSKKTSFTEVKLNFLSLYLKYLCGDTGKIAWQDITPVSEQDLTSYNSISDQCIELGKTMISKAAVLKLNGGLGTTMGCKGPKSSIKVTDNLSFLELIAAQMNALRRLYNTPVPLILLNSYYTSAETAAILSNTIDYMDLSQNEFPRIDTVTGFPFIYHADPDQEWNPPGHGDIFSVLHTSGLLDQLLDKGISYLFISNADNLGAVLDPKILGFICENKIDFLMETTLKSNQDVKGGTLVRHHNHLQLLERAQVEQSHLTDFEDIKTFKVFNTNSIWLNLSTLKQALSSGFLKLPLIVNEKTIHDHPVVQLETAMGAGIAHFKNSCSVIVDRNRFLPVKKTSDLMILQSDLIEKDDNGNFKFSPNRKISAYPPIRLSSHFNTVDDYMKRITAPPSLKEMTSLTLDGDITIGPNVIFKGEVKIHVEKGQAIHLEAVTMENEQWIADSCGRTKRSKI
ncbi:UTP--glucose-1-phosphate uridylyltransferase [Thermoproteota archaeon]